MLTSLEVENYRNFKHLTIEKLGRVNLIIGKNNTGKSSLLEAVSILIKQNDLDWIYSILEKRREHFEVEEMNPQQKLKSISNLFYGRKTAFDDLNSIRIVANSFGKNKSLTLRVSSYKETNAFSEVDTPPEVSELLGQMYSKREEVDPSIGEKFGIKFTIDDKVHFSSFSRESVLDMMNVLKGNSQRENMVQYVTTNTENETFIFDLWQKTQLTEAEFDVIKALQVFDSSLEKIERIGFATQNDIDYAICKVKGIPSPIPLRSMGDGINRVLTIILAMVNCQDGYFLVDEFDMGLHHSVQKQLWEIVFYLANKLNIQVFATTHSQDTIKTFQTVANGKAEYEDTILIKLVNKQGNIEAITANANELEEIVEDLIDIR